MPNSNALSGLSVMLKMLGVAALYALLSHVVHIYFEAGAENSALEPAGGVALAALLIGGRRYVWGVLLGAFAINAMVIHPFVDVAAVTLGNTLEAFCGAWLLRRGGESKSTIYSLRDYLRLIALGGGVGVAVGVLVGTTALLVFGSLDSGEYVHYLLQWWAGDMLGVMLIAPLILVGWQTRNERFDAKLLFEAILLLGLAFLAGQIVFLDWLHDSIGEVAGGYWMFALIAWIAVRLGVLGVVAMLIMTALQALLGAYFGIGYFADDIADTHLANYWFFMVVLSVVGMALATYFAERKQNELALARLGRLYRLLSQINEAIVRAHDRNALFAAICDAAATSGLFRMAWIGMLDKERSSVMPVAHAGVEEGYLDNLNIRLDGGGAGNGPTGRAIREGVPVIVADIGNDPRMLPWRDEALKRGYRASAAFPIREAESVAGAINVYAIEPNFFTPDIVNLMLELSENISFSLDVFAGKERREQAEDEIRQLNLELEQRVLERTGQLEAANKELEAFSYSVSHDLRAPLRSIDGFSQILSKKYHDLLDETGRDYLGRVRRASQRMGELIDDMLELSQVSRSSLKRGRVDLSEIANSVADDLRKTNPERQVRFTLQQGLSPYGDAGLLRIVMDNLLGNAYKYSGKNSGAEIEFGMRDIDGENVFFVRDNGAGFNMDYVHKLFGAFQRLHAANEFEGTGIGLATVQRIIHRHRGRVWAEGKEGQGATFYFTLPQRTRER